MNIVVWASLQSLDVLNRIDLMLPDLIDEEELEILEIISPVKTKVVESSLIQNAIANGGMLTAIGMVILAIPDPLVFAAGSFIAGPVGGWVAVALVNVVGFGLIILDQYI